MSASLVPLQRLVAQLCHEMAVEEEDVVRR